MFGKSVQQGGTASNPGMTVGPGRRAFVSVIRGRDVLGAFIHQVEQLRPRRVEIVSPWVSDGSALPRLSRLLAHLERVGGSLTLTTRPPVSDAEHAFVDRVRAFARAKVVLQPALHAKVFLCDDARGGGVAIIGSANATRGSLQLAESAVMIRPLRRSKVLREIARAVASLAEEPLHRRNGTPMKKHYSKEGSDVDP
jgi:phosphatidylserine/phosphatidylglycerophosphate/cardiolipin synthase-like enzyme